MTKALSPLAAELAEARTNAKFWKERAQFLAVQVKQEREDTRLAKAAAKRAKEETAAAKAADRIAKAQARLDKLLAKQAGLVGSKAAKANRKPGKVVTYGAEDNAIASAIMAKKASA
jgi:glutathione S-transferase